MNEALAAIERMVMAAVASEEKMSLANLKAQGEMLAACLKAAGTEDGTENFQVLVSALKEVSLATIAAESAAHIATVDGTTAAVKILAATAREFAPAVVASEERRRAEVDLRLLMAQAGSDLSKVPAKAPDLGPGRRRTGRKDKKED
jgi:hypothetical protein